MTNKTARVALVTGAGSGLGRETAAGLVRAGFITYASARRPETLAGLVALGCLPLTLDVANEESRVAAIQAIEERHGALDLLVNNAADGRLGPIEEVGLADWQRQFETNVFGLVRLTQLALPPMRARGSGRIINISSMGGEMTFPFAGSYHATKYALEAISDALRLEVKPFGIEVVVVQPGGIKTALGAAGLEMLRPKVGSPYATTLGSFAEQSRRSFESGQGVLTAAQVAAVVVAAAQARRPKTRYKIGSTARMLTILRRVLPDRAWDALLGRMMGGASQGKTVSAGN